MSDRSILVVDDDAAMRQMLVEQLRDHGYDARAVPGVEPALESLARDSFHAVLCDVQMTSRDGFELLEEATRRGVPAPVVLMSAFSTPEMERRALAEGAFAFLSKPFGERELLDVLARVPRSGET